MNGKSCTRGKRCSREQWLKEGDKNMKFYHVSVQQRRDVNIIFEIEEASLGRLLNNLSILTLRGGLFSELASSIDCTLFFSQS